MSGVGASDRALTRGTRRVERSLRDFGGEVLEARAGAGVSQRELGRRVGMSGTKIGRMEAGNLQTLSIRDAARVAAVLGMDLHVRAYPAGPRLRDAAHAARLGRLLAPVSPPLSCRLEVALPQRPDRPPELRSWDAMLMGGGKRTAVEMEMRPRDGQAFERRIAAKLRDDAVDSFLLLVADTRGNRRMLGERPELFMDLPRLKTSSVLKLIEAGQHPPTGLMLI